MLNTKYSIIFIGYSIIIVTLLVFLPAKSFSAEVVKDSTKSQHMQMNMDMDHSKTQNHDMNHDMMSSGNMNHDKMSSGKNNNGKSSIVREGIINLSAIDENKDGKVYQDVMDWNVISDKSGKCPLCKMTLKEVTLKEAKANLEKNGFKVK